MEGIVLSYLNAAKVLDELMLELIARGLEIPGHVIDELKAGRSFVGISSRNPEDINIAAKAELALQNVEMNLLALAEIDAGTDYAEAWQRRVAGAYNKEFTPGAPVSGSRMVSGVPKGEHWIRVQTSELADERPGDFALTAKPQDDGYTLIYGKKEDISAFLNKIRQKFRKDGCEINAGD